MTASRFIMFLPPRLHDPDYIPSQYKHDAIDMSGDQTRLSLPIQVKHKYVETPVIMRDTKCDKQQTV